MDPRGVNVPHFQDRAYLGIGKIASMADRHTQSGQIGRRYKAGFRLRKERRLLLARIRKRYENADPGAGRLDLHKRDRSIHLAEPLVHTEDAEPTALSGAFEIESHAVVRNFQAQFARGPGDLDPSALRTTVLDDVPERLLNDPVEAQCDAAGKRLWDPVMHEFDIDSVLVGNLLAEALGCCHEAKVLKNGGMKLMGQAMDVR